MTALQATPSSGDPPTTTPVRRRQLPTWAELAARWSWGFIGMAIAASIVLVTLAALRELVVPLVVATLSAVVFAPAVDWLEARRVPRSIAALACTLLVVTAAIVIMAVVIVGLVDQADELSALLNNAWSELDQLTSSPAVSDFLTELNVDLSTTSETILEGAGARVGSLINSAIGLVSGLVLALVLVYYLLKDGAALARGSAARRTPDTTAQTERIMAHAARTIRANSKGRSILAAIQAAVVGIVMAILGVPLPATIGLVTFIGAFVPFIGAFISGAFAVLMALSAGGFAYAAWTLLAVLVMNLVLENMLEPRLMGSRMRIRPVTVLVATVAGGIVAGLLGLILAAPLAAIVSNLFRELRASGYFGAVPASPPETPAP